MRKISWDQYEEQIKLAKVDFLQIKDETTKKVSGNLRTRDKEKRLLLYKLAKNKQEKMLKEIGERKYKLID
jgi:hypothetical protein